ncbi:carboxylesterase family protein [uncultured Streptococcus sp.]|uniref:carboxylesterase family protein n=1 Tax=uncultured Streptococcus sp. TaxID=83427 RepID=UPI0027DABD7A|nr:carboxylesterase family protein [uncultured Streptococcus sp.]
MTLYFSLCILVSGPVIDDLIPYTPWEAMEKGISSQVKCIFGTCRDEGNLFYMMKMMPTSWSQIEDMLAHNQGMDLLPVLKDLYSDLSEKEAMRAFSRDRMFWARSISCDIAQSPHNTVYQFRYDLEPFLCKLVGLGATHGVDICSGLDTWVGPMFLFNKFTSKKRLLKIHQDFHGAFVHFCKYGRPGMVDGIDWQTYTEDNKYTFIFDDKYHSTVNPNEKYYEIWKDIDLYQ